MTPPGTAALAVIAIRGPRAWHVISSRFQPLTVRDWPPRHLQAGNFWLGQFRASERGLVDHVIVGVDRADEQTWIEVHCHGGREVVRWIGEILETEGIASVSWQTLQTETAGRATDADIEAALAQAPTIRTAAILLDQVQGAMAREIAEMLSRWPGEETGKALATLASRVEMGLHLVEPWKIAVLGAPNVGKSALVNALAGYTRSIVSEVPGTTRDLLSVRLAIDGWPMELWDTAGMRESASSLEKEGMQKAREAGTRADICIWVLDSSESPVWPDFAHARLQLVINKIDLQPAWAFQRDAHEAQIDRDGPPKVSLRVPTVSAKTDEGMSELCQAISGWLVPEPPSAGSAVPCTAAIAERIQTANRLFAQRQYDQARLELLSILKPERRSTERQDSDI
jgi:tRNA modification GTPase